MRLLLIAASLLLLSAPASALCRCTCVKGEMKAICQPTDLMIPICQGFCETTIQQERVVTPLAGGKPEYGQALSTNPSPGRIEDPQIDLNTNPSGTALGLPSQFSGSVGSSLSGGGR